MWTIPIALCLFGVAFADATPTGGLWPAAAGERADLNGRLRGGTAVCCREATEAHARPIVTAAIARCYKDRKFRVAGRSNLKPFSRHSQRSARRSSGRQISMTRNQHLPKKQPPVIGEKPRNSIYRWSFCGRSENGYCP